MTVHEAPSQPEDDEQLATLVRLSRRIGDPVNDYVIAAEGNTSVRLDDGTCWVKASGARLEGIREEDFVRLRLEPLLKVVSEPGPVAPGAVDEAFELAGSARDRRPSIETFVHAVALGAGGARYVVHTHPTTLTGLLCSAGASTHFQAPLFPDEVVVCGRAPLFVPYFEPGLPLGRALLSGLLEHRERYGESPRIVLLANHGLVALGQSAAEVLTATAMMVKAAQVRAVALAVGGIAPLAPASVEELAARPDELRRSAQLFSSALGRDARS